MRMFSAWYSIQQSCMYPPMCLVPNDCHTAPLPGYLYLTICKDSQMENGNRNDILFDLSALKRFTCNFCVFM